MSSACREWHDKLSQRLGGKGGPGGNVLDGWRFDGGSALFIRNDG